MRVQSPPLLHLAKVPRSSANGKIWRNARRRSSRICQSAGLPVHHNLLMVVSIMLGLLGLVTHAGTGTMALYLASARAVRIAITHSCQTHRPSCSYQRSSVCGCIMVLTPPLSWVSFLVVDKSSLNSVSGLWAEDSFPIAIHGRPKSIAASSST